MERPTFPVPENPQWDGLFSMLINQDTANAETVFNPQAQQFVQHLYALKLMIDEAPEIVEALISAHINQTAGQKATHGIRWEDGRAQMLVDDEWRDICSCGGDAAEPPPLPTFQVFAGDSPVVTTTPGGSTVNIFAG